MQIAADTAKRDRFLAITGVTTVTALTAAFFLGLIARNTPPHPPATSQQPTQIVDSAYSPIAQKS